MKNKYLYFMGIASSAVCLGLSYYIGETKQATEATTAAILETLRWF